MSAKKNKIKNSQASKLKVWDRNKSKKQKNKEPEEEATTAPRITSDTVAEHREEVLSGARRFIYPLQHSRKKVLIISSLIIVGVLLSSIAVSSLMLYRYQNTGNFAYRISQLFPFPVAKVDGTYVPYENYLFEMSYSLYYFETTSQEGVDIRSSEGDEIVRELKTRALEKVKLDAMAAKLAEANGIEITQDDVNRQVQLIRENTGVGDSDQAFEEIIRTSYNWSQDDLERSLRLQLTRQALPRVLDTETLEKSQNVKKRSDNGSDFAALAEKYSDDQLTKGDGGLIGIITRTNTALPPEFIDAAFELEEGQVSDIVESRFGLHLIRVNKIDGDEREVSHILFTFFDVEEFLRAEIEKVETVDYITIQ